jgi:hypothetical protein
MNDDFYALNRAQDFQFPHNICDRYTNDQLLHVFFQGSPNYGHFIIQYFQRKHNHYESVSVAVMSDKYICLLACTYMRLKFISEVYHSFNTCIHNNQMARIVKPLKNHAVWNIEPSMRIYKIDTYLNCLQAEMYTCIESHVSGNPVAHTYDSTTLNEFGTALQTLRATPLDNKFVWDKMVPHEMHPYVYAHFAIALWKIVNELLGIVDG